jgi:hypothetical protein
MHAVVVAEAYCVRCLEHFTVERSGACGVTRESPRAPSCNAKSDLLCASLWKSMGEHSHELSYPTGLCANIR